MTGSASLADLFQGRSQLLVYHFMFGPDYKAGCPSCSAIADGFNGFAVHLANHDVTLAAVSRAPLAEAAGVQAADGMGVPLGVLGRQRLQFRLQRLRSPQEQQREGGIEYNYRRGGHRDGSCATGCRRRRRPDRGPCGTDAPAYSRDRPGMSASSLEDGVVYHTYSTYARGLDGLWGMYQWLDRAPKGRNETGVWWRRHDKYDKR